MEPEDSRKAMAKLGLAAESMFQALSTLTSCSKFIESVYEGVDFSVTLSRARLEALISPLLPQMTQPILEALNLAGLETCLIHKVVLCGAPLKTPRLVSYVRGLFPEGVEVLQTLSPDEVLATGAARQASYFINYPLAAPITDPTLSLPVLSSPLYIQVNILYTIVLKHC
ncbi:hypothetical protein AAG570_005260 [Ranatra chinensis]|uniref:Heat shock protein 70 n=1 Tax=Ranatra chinensis TaxID=642074 RepID=A0ABD0YES2_9HEMI